MLLPHFLYEAEKGGAGSSDDGGEGDPQKTELTFDTWVKDQPDDVKTMLEGRHGRVLADLVGERKTRQDLEKKVRDLAAKSEKDGEMQKQLTDLADKMGEADRRAEFFEAAHAVGVTNLKLAYTVAVTDEMFDRRGQVNFEQLKQQYPELFGSVRKQAPGGAGNGTGGEQKPTGTMNDWIRKKSGRA